jgi:hypothetical protein
MDSAELVGGFEDIRTEREFLQLRFKLGEF